MTHAPERSELVVTERAGYIVYLLMRGKTLTTAEIANVLGMTPNGAWQLMSRLSRKVPLRQDLGYWFIVNMSDCETDNV